MHRPLQHDKFLFDHHVELGDAEKHKHLRNRAAVMSNENVQNESKWSESIRIGEIDYDAKFKLPFVFGCFWIVFGCFHRHTLDLSNETCWQVIWCVDETISQTENTFGMPLWN